MTLRTAGSGKHEGEQFWGCSTFPKCWNTLPLQPSEGTHPEAVADMTFSRRRRRIQDEPTASGPPKSDLLLAAERVLRLFDKVRAWTLEFTEPDANGHWPPEHRRKVLRFIWGRDGRRCGLCGGAMKRLHTSAPGRGPQIDHIVPKVFAVFDLDEDGKARPGTRYKSRFHKMDNLQAAHSYCNRRKGNTQYTSKWRHPSMPRLPVARTRDGETLYLP